MRIFQYYLFLIFIILGFISCQKEMKSNHIPENININYSQKLLKKIEKNGDFINTKKTQDFLLKAKEVNDLVNSNSNIHIIDLRTGKDFSEGHIKGAINIKFSELFDYFLARNIKGFDKVIMVCYTGQTASYITSLFQLQGFHNVYSMKFGMSAWNDKFSKKWKDGISDKLVGKLQTSENAKNQKNKLPDFKCKKSSETEILELRTKKLLKDGFKKAIIPLKDIVSKEDDFYIIHYGNKKLYEKGHLKNAVFYDLLKADLETLPNDKTILVYSSYGQESAFIVSYLRLLNYDAKTLKFGANSFMNTSLKENSFSEKEIYNFPFETSEYIKEEGKVEEGGC